ncbi:hypothetical protein F8Y91_04080 [Vibrio alginolyticus]|nr:hypothetical protein [Vibrio alginolyticus]EGR0800550.1 hypothetical protein [Vibrio alginolyticus]
MDKPKQVQWLKIRKKGFLIHCLTHGLTFSFPVIFVSSFVRNGFYLNLSPIVSYRVYLMTVFGAVFMAGMDWCFKRRQYQKRKEKASPHK